MRGKGRRTQLVQQVVGITPAYAGKRAKRSGLKVAPRDHPRVCGEKHIEQIPQFLPMGSPPRMRGKGSRVIRALRVSGITPAYAGKRAGLALLLPLAGDHPRVCGEKSQKPPGIWAGEGSPPRMRGKATRSCFWQLLTGITPAYAGKRVSYIAGRQYRGDHPRVCGEKVVPTQSMVSCLGSPPRMRGKVIRCSICHRGSGITPAYAGKSIK